MMAIVCILFLAFWLFAFVAGIAVGYMQDNEDRSHRRAGWPLRLAARFDAKWEGYMISRERGWK